MADPTKEAKEIHLHGEIPSPVNPPSGCRFHPRCSLKIAVCAEKEPPLVEIGDGHLMACHVTNRVVLPYCSE